jgi:Glycosyl transferase family 2
MGRLLLRVFLASCIVAAVAVVVAVIELVWYLFTLIPGRVVDPPALLSITQGDPSLLVYFALYFFVVIPLAAIAFLVHGAIRRDRLRKNGVPAVAPPVIRDHPYTVAVLTAYNDEASIGLAVNEFRQIRCIDQVVVVDNNCVDRTAEVAREAGATVIPEAQQGYGFACMRGLRYALESTPADRIVLAEGDMTFFSNDTEKLLPYLADCDLVIGTRTTRTLTRDGSQMDWFMAWGNMFLASLIRMRYWDPVFMGQARLTDVGCTFRAMRREPLQKIIDQLTVGGNYFSPHMILVALQNQMRVVEVPIKFRKRVGVSKGAGGDRQRAIGIGLQMLAEITFH